MNSTQTERKVSYDVRSVMDILYGEESDNTNGAFVCANDGKQAAQEDEVIQLPRENRDYSTFWRK